MLPKIATENFAKTIRNMFVQCLQDHVWCRSTIISGCIFLENYCSIWHSTGNYMYLYVKIITFLPRCSIDFPHFHTYWYILVHVLKITSMNSDSNMCASLFKFYMYVLKSKKAWFQLSLVPLTTKNLKTTERLVVRQLSLRC